MKKIRLNLKERSYDIIIGSGILRLIGSKALSLRLGSCAYVITNARIKSKYGKLLAESLSRSGFEVRFKLIPDTEKSKSLKTAFSIIKNLAGIAPSKRVFIVALGGGVVGDIAGFVASVYRRGIPYIQVPTTLLAQVDSGIGGKTAVDLDQGKNLVGAFYQPSMVISDTGVLKTLNPRQIKSGLAEVIKYGLIRDVRLFEYLEKKYKDVLALNRHALEFIVARCSAIKAGIVEQDEKERKGIRTMLNFGHTLGHAIEAACGYKSYNHGEAVALGMLLAMDIGKKTHLTNAAALDRAQRLIKNVGLPVRLRNASVSKILTAHYRDKKFIGGQNRFVLLRDIGSVKIAQNLTPEIIKGVLVNRLT